MGNIESQTSANIQREKKVYEEKEEPEKRLKVLLLGTGESGKSTILKQMKILHKNGWTEEELIKIKPLIRAHIIDSIIAIVTAMKTFEIPLENLIFGRDMVLTVLLDEPKEFEGQRLFENTVYDALNWLWLDQGVQQCYGRSNEYHLGSSSKYFLDSLDRINSQDYIPTFEDMLRLGLYTTEVAQGNFQIKDCNIWVFDVGGKRNERRKWTDGHLFDDVTCLLFVAAISEYDQTLQENENKNRLIEAIQLFHCIVNSPCFKKTTIILFLNKVDIFEEKIKTSPITKAFPKYRGPRDYEFYMEFIKRKFLEYVEYGHKIVVHEISATDTSQVEKVMASVLDSLMEKL